MAYPADWDVFKENASMFVGVDPVAPIVGAGSLAMHRGATAGRYAHVVRAEATGWTSGVLRCLVKVKTFGQSDDVIGMLFQQSQADLTGSTGQAYLAGLRLVTSTIAQPRLYKYQAGLADYATLAYIATGLPAYNIGAGGPLAMEVRWVLDPEGLGGLHIAVRYGRALNYSDLVTVLSIIDTQDVLQFSVGEGLAMRLNSASSNLQCLFDQIEGTPLLLTGG